MIANKNVWNNIVWMAAGAVVLSVFLAVIGLFRTGTLISDDSSVRGEMKRLVVRMQLDLGRESEAEKSAVLAESDKDSAEFAVQARSALDDVELGRREVEVLMQTRGSAVEKTLFDQFSMAFAELAKVDETLLDLAVKNTNVKAYALAFGPATQALRDLETSLSGLVMSGTEERDASRIAYLAFTVQTGALHIQTMFAPHIAESDDEKMDALEAIMSGEDKKIEAALEALSQFRAVKDSASLRSARSAYSRFEEIAGQILALSRENSNVRSLALSLDQKRKAFLKCQSALSALQAALPDPQPMGGKFGRTK